MMMSMVRYLKYTQLDWARPLFHVIFDYIDTVTA